MSKSEAVVIESIEVRELLHFLFYLEILNKLSLLQRKHSKYMYAKCLNFPCFITYLSACMHAFCMFYLYVSLGCLLTNLPLKILLSNFTLFLLLLRLVFDVPILSKCATPFATSTHCIQWKPFGRRL